MTAPTGDRTGELIADLRVVDGALPEFSGAPRVVRILAENVLRNLGTDPTDVVGSAVAAGGLDVVSQLIAAGRGQGAVDLDFRPTRLLLQDHSGVPVLADLAALRSMAHRAGADPARVRLALPVDLVIDHSVEAFATASEDALTQNLDREFALNAERYRFLRWADAAVDGLRVVPPGKGIVHQIHLERLARVVMRDHRGILAPDTVLGTDSHTPMVNALGVLGWGVGGVEASSAMFGHSVSVAGRPVIGIRLMGRLRSGVLATDLALWLAQFLRGRGVVGAICEFFGLGLSGLSVEDRATVANMTPEYGCLAAYFPVDAAVLAYLGRTGRPVSQVDRVERYTRGQGLFEAGDGTAPADFADVWDVDLGAVEASAAGPSRPQDRLLFSAVPSSVRKVSDDLGNGHSRDGSIAIAAITSCTNTANPRLIVMAALIARRAVDLGLRVPGWVKTSFAPGSRRVVSYLEHLDLLEPLESLGFHVVGYGCTTCIGNSGPLTPQAQAWTTEGAQTFAVLSGNRNFDGRIHPAIAGSYLMSPPMVVAYALSGNMLVDLDREPLGVGRDGRLVLLSDLLSAPEEVEEAVVAASRFEAADDVFAGDNRWNSIEYPTGPVYDWPRTSTYLQPSPLVSLHERPLDGLINARVLVLAPDSTTTDHISPAGRIHENSASGQLLRSAGIQPEEFNSYGCRRGNHEVLVRGTFANPRFRNRLTPGLAGAWTVLFPQERVVPLHEAAQDYRARQVPLVIVAGRDYGMGSSRDWAAKGPRLLGVRAVLAVSFERIHRSNLVGVGIVPLEFLPGDDADSLGLTGHESITVEKLFPIEPGGLVQVQAVRSDGAVSQWQMKLRIDTVREAEVVRGGGFLPMLANDFATIAGRTVREDLVEGGLVGGRAIGGLAGGRAEEAAEDGDVA